MKKLFSILPILALVIVLVSTVAAGKKPVNLYLVGDGTVAECTENTGKCGWGQALSTYLREHVNLHNYAKVGSSTKSFIMSDELEALTNQLRRGDVVLLQFGHEDEQESDPKRYSSVADFESNLQEIIKQVKKHHAKVIICTPMARRVFNDHTGKLADTHGAYSEAVRRVVEATNTPFVDLGAVTMDWLSSTDKELTANCFADKMYLTEMGATEVARLVATEIKNQGIKSLASHILLAE